MIYLEIANQIYNKPREEGEREFEKDNLFPDTLDDDKDEQT